MSDDDRRARDPEGLDRLLDAVRPRSVVDGWATVELDRGERVASSSLAASGLAVTSIEPAPDDDSLGARARILRQPDGRTTLVLEPSTEGLLAAALARHGEGNVVRYLLADEAAPARARDAGFGLTVERAGPLGPQRLVLGGPRWGPFLVLVLDPVGGARPDR